MVSSSTALPALVPETKGPCQKAGTKKPVNEDPVLSLLHLLYYYRHTYTISGTRAIPDKGVYLYRIDCRALVLTVEYWS